MRQRTATSSEQPLVVRLTCRGCQGEAEPLLRACFGDFQGLDPSPVDLSPFKSLQSLELHWCELVTAPPTGLQVRPPAPLTVVRSARVSAQPLLGGSCL